MLDRRQMMRGWGICLIALISLVAMLVAPAFSQAQSLPPICDEYPNLPVCNEGGGGGGGDNDGGNSDNVGNETGAGGGSLGGGGGGSGAELPFTGYPLTPLLLLALILLASGLALRAWLAYRDRRAATQSANGPGPQLY